MSSEYSIRNISFVKSAGLRSSQITPARPEIAIAGRSNAGKSSLINRISNRRKMAYVGKQPGKTRLVNYFLVNDDFYLVDLPGYGYAKVSKAELLRWAEMMDQFLANATAVLRGILVCMDIRRDPSRQDLQMLEWASYYGIPCAIAATKSDKIAKSKRPAAASRISRFCAEEFDSSQQPPVFPVSSVQGTGIPSIIDWIGRTLDA